MEQKVIVTNCFHFSTKDGAGFWGPSDYLNGFSKKKNGGMKRNSNVVIFFTTKYQNANKFWMLQAWKFHNRQTFYYFNLGI